MLKAEDFLRLTDKQRRHRGRTYGKKRKCYIRRRRKSRAELIEFLKENNVRTARQLKTVKVEEEKDRPTIYHYISEFGTWNNAKREAFGGKSIIDSHFDAEYLIKVIVEFGLWTVKKYLAARRLRPDIIPSYRQVRNKWGRFSNMKYVARAYSFREQIDAYVKLKRDVTGHWPTNDELRDNGVNISKAVEFFGSKKKLQDFIRDLERQKKKCGAKKR